MKWFNLRNYVLKFKSSGKKDPSFWRSLKNISQSYERKAERGRHVIGCTVGYQSKCRFQNRSEKTFKTANFESLPRAQKLVFSHESFTKALSLSYLYVCQISRPKDTPTKSYSKSTNIGSCGKFFTAANFDNLPNF
jgi:hypothetical protein